MSLSLRIKEKAAELGFCKTGIVAANRLETEGGRFFRWLQDGFHGEMAWVNREPEKRVDPKLIFPDARSLVVLAMNYYTPHEHDDSTPAGKISRYAWGDDYHDVMRERLRELLEWIKMEDPEADGKICVDTTPVLEKAWAVRAGIGWLGKHTNVITPTHGSWVFLGGLWRTADGSLFRTWKPGHAAHLNGYLEDYANVADGLVALYEATFEPRWLATAVELADAIHERFTDPENGGFFDTSTSHET